MKESLVFCPTIDTFIVIAPVTGECFIFSVLNLLHKLK